MRLDIPHDYDYEPRRERPRDIEPPSQPPEREAPEMPLLPVTRRLERLQEQAVNKRQIGIPRRHYERKRVAEVPIDREPGERHVRNRHHLPLTLTHLRLHREEKQLLGEVGRFRELALKDAAQTMYGGDEHALRSDLRFLEKHELVSIDPILVRRCPGTRWGFSRKAKGCTAVWSSTNCYRHGAVNASRRAAFAQSLP